MSVKWRAVLLAVLVFLLIYAGFYYWMLRSVKETLTSIYLDGVDGRKASSAVSDAVRADFDRFLDYPAKEPQDVISFRLSTGKAVHAFTRGTVWLRYSYEGLDPTTKKAKYGSSDVPIRVKAKLQHGRWIIVDKFEQP